MPFDVKSYVDGRSEETTLFKTSLTTILSLLWETSSHASSILQQTSSIWRGKWLSSLVESAYVTKAENMSWLTLFRLLNSTGIGLATVRHLARAGAKVYLAARNESRPIGAIAQLEHEGLGPGNGEVLWLKLDLSDPRDAKKAAGEFMARETRLDILGSSLRISVCIGF